jgi:hypothetical protein
VADVTTVPDGTELTDAQLTAIIAKIDLDIYNLVAESKTPGLNYSEGGAVSRSVSRAANMKALMEMRKYYKDLLEQYPAEYLSQACDPDTPAIYSAMNGGI